MNTVTINGMTFTGMGNVTIGNNRVIIEGVDMTPDSKVITIEINGDVGILQADACKSVSITGNVGSVSMESGDVSGKVTAESGNVRCGTVGGKVETSSGSVTCTTVNGDVKTVTGNVSCTTVSGQVSTTTGNIRHT